MMPEAVMLRPNLSYEIRRAALRMARGETTPRANNVARHKLTVSYLVEKRQVASLATFVSR